MYYNTSHHITRIYTPHVTFIKFIDETYSLKMVSRMGFIAIICRFYFLKICFLNICCDSIKQVMCEKKNQAPLTSPSINCKNTQLGQEQINQCQEEGLSTVKQHVHKNYWQR